MHRAAVAFRSVQLAPADAQFFGMEYRRFLLIMFTEIAMYTVFVTVGVLARKRPKIHRPMMLLASLTILAGATARMPFLSPFLVNRAGWVCSGQSSASERCFC